FEIDLENNAGLDFQYDEVVWNKAARKKMHGGNYECCCDSAQCLHDFNRRSQDLQPPLYTMSCWRKVESSKKRDALEAISRHRHPWALTNTPPGYWNIAF
ncbi:hypothetical protein C8J56DRAFT_730722, partial [Mycena floridula]